MPRSGWLAVGAVAGALVATWGGKVVVVLPIIAVVAAVASAGAPPRRRRLTKVLAIATISATLVASRAVTSAPMPPASLPTGDGPWQAVVVSVSAVSGSSRPATVTISTSQGDLLVAARLPVVPVVTPSSTIEVEGLIEPVPDGPYGDWLRRLGAAGVLDARSLTLGRTAAATTGSNDDVERLRRAAADALDAAVPEPAAGLAAGIIVGLRDRVDRELAADFTTAGVSHVVAISGWNIAIVAGCAMAATSRLHRRRRVAIALMTIAVYTLFVGASASVVRAALMAGVALVARETGRPATAVAALGWAVTLLVLADPGMALDAGFQLSVLGTLGLVVWSGPLETRLRRLAPRSVPDPLVEAIAVSLAAQAATLPIVLATFGRLSTVAPMVNLVVVPLVPPAMAACVVALAGGALVAAGLPSVLGLVAGAPAWALLSIAIAVVRTAAALPGASLELPSPVDGLAGIIATACLLLAWRRPRSLAAMGTLRGAGTIHAVGRPPPPRSPGDRAPRDRSPKRRRTVALVALAVVATSGATAVARLPDGALTIEVLDVGQGDAILLVGPAGSRLLVDGGPDPDRLQVRLDERLPPWDRRIDMVVLTHPHEDHVAGLLALAGRYRLARLYEPGMRGPGPGYRAWRAGLERVGVATTRLTTGDRLRLDGIVLEVLWPDRGAVPDEPADDGTAVNNVSIVLLGSIGRQRFLLTGDIEEEIDPLLVERGIPRVEVLKVAHHGSRTASTEAFLQAAEPAVAVVSAGRGNAYGHPAGATLRRLTEGGATVLRTDRNGSVQVRLDGRTTSFGVSRGTADAAEAVTRRAAVVAPFGVFACRVPRGGSAPPRDGASDGLGYHPPDAHPRPFGQTLGPTERYLGRDPATCDRDPSASAIGRRADRRYRRRH